SSERLQHWSRKASAAQWIVGRLAKRWMRAGESEAAAFRICAGEWRNGLRIIFRCKTARLFVTSLSDFISRFYQHSVERRQVEVIVFRQSDTPVPLQFHDFRIVGSVRRGNVPESWPVFPRNPSNQSFVPFSDAREGALGRVNGVQGGLIELIAIVGNERCKKCGRDAGRIQTSEKKGRLVIKRIHKCSPWTDRRYLPPDMGEDVLA